MIQIEMSWISKLIPGNNEVFGFGESPYSDRFRDSSLGCRLHDTQPRRHGSRYQPCARTVEPNVRCRHRKSDTVSLGGSNRGERRGGARRSSLEDAIPDCKNTERRDSDLRICSTTISNHTRNRARASFPLSSRSRSVRPLGHSGGSPRSWPVHSRPDVWTRSLDCPPWCRRRNCGGNGAVRTGRISATHGLTTRARLTDRFAPGRANDDTEIDTHSRGN